MTQIKLIENGSSWISDYQEVDANAVFVQKWVETGKKIEFMDLLRRLPDHQKPQLPQGYIFLQDGDQVKILEHKKSPSKNLKIYLFGPDDKDRISYLVADGDTPIQGFAMTKQEKFPTNLRSKYPITLKSYTTEDGVKYWRGHIIDYQDTLGDVKDKDISTIFLLNYKPEPYKTWAETLRKYIVTKLRKAEGSYTEIMLHNFVPAQTRGGARIPEAVFF